MKEFLKRHLIQVIILVPLIYFPLYFATAEHGNSQLLEPIAKVTTLPVLSVLSKFLVEDSFLSLLIYHFTTLVFAVITAFFSIYLWQKFISPTKLIKRVVVTILVIFLSFKIYNSVGFLYGSGLSFPPNRCDLVFGFEEGGSLIVPKRVGCLFKLAVQQKNPLVCRNLGNYYSDSCVRAVADEKNDVLLCKMISGNYNRERCLISFAEEFVASDINKALEICQGSSGCKTNIIAEYQEVNGIAGKKLVLKCLNYKEDDSITKQLCSLSSNINYLTNWQGHHEIFYMYGNKYPSIGKKMCEVVAALTKYPNEIDWCYKTVEGHTKEMSREGSDFYNFLQANPNGLGESL